MTLPVSWTILCSVLVVLVSAIHADSDTGLWERKYVLNISDEEALERAREVLSQYPLIDGNNDLPIQYRVRVQNDIHAIDMTYNVTGQWGYSDTDIPRQREGMVGAQFWVVCDRCQKYDRDELRATLEDIDATRRFVSRYDDYMFVDSAQGILDAFDEGKIAGLIGIEGGHVIDSSLGALRMLYDVGVRYMSPTHICSTPWADADGDDTLGGLSDWGELVIREMNRLGMIVDLSHTSWNTQRHVLNISLAPVIHSHSNVWHFCHSGRNVPDDIMDLTAANGGMIMLMHSRGAMGCYPSNGTDPGPETVADQIEYIRDRVGVDHVGFGADYDGVYNMARDLEDVSKYPNVIAELVKRGWSDEDMEKVAGRNIIRVMRRVEEVRDEMSGEREINDWIPTEDWEDAECRTEL